MTTRLTIDLRMYRHSGIGRYLRNLVPALLPLLEAEHIRVIGSETLFASPEWLRDPRVEIYETPAAVYSVAEQMLPLRDAYANTRLLWVPHYNAPLLYRGRLALTIHDIAPIALPEIMSSAVKRAYARLLIEHAVGRASAILCPSSFSAQELVRYLGADLAKLTVAPLGLDTFWETEANPHREDDELPYLLYVGNVKPNKNLTMLLQAFRQVMDRIPHRLVLAGRMRGFGTGDDAVLQQAQALGQRVRFTDEIADTELISLYAGATALVFPSLYEGFGLPVLEAMQMRCPVLSSNAASLPEIGGDAAVYFDPRSVESLASCLLRVQDKTLMHRLSVAGLERSHSFSYAQCALTTAAVLNPLLRES